MQHDRRCDTGQRSHEHRVILGGREHRSHKHPPSYCYGHLMGTIGPDTTPAIQTYKHDTKHPTTTLPRPPPSSPALDNMTVLLMWGGSVGSPTHHSAPTALRAQELLLPQPCIHGNLCHTSPASKVDSAPSSPHFQSTAQPHKTLADRSRCPSAPHAGSPCSTHWLMSMTGLDTHLSPRVYTGMRL